MININGKDWNKLRLKDIEKFLSNIEDDETFFIELFILLIFQLLRIFKFFV